MNIISKIEQAWRLLQQGKLIAYPTEAVYGIGCDPFNQEAVAKLLALKQRAPEKGLIILIADWAQLTPLITPISQASMSAVKNTWPGPTTWIFPKSALIPDWLCGNNQTIAIRMSAHPVASQLSIPAPVVSTSANLSGDNAARNLAELSLQFPHGIDAVVAGELGGRSQPSAIFEVLTGRQLR